MCHLCIHIFDILRYIYIYIYRPASQTICLGHVLCFIEKSSQGLQTGTTQHVCVCVCATKTVHLTSAINKAKVTGQKT